MTTQTFELLILGTSAAIPALERNPSAQFLNIAERYFLIDCGESTQIQLRKYKAKIQSINHILISHLHGDHFLGLPGLLSSMQLLGREKELIIYCPQELHQLIENINAVSDTRLNYPIKWVYTNSDGLNLIFEDNKVQVYSFPLRHRIYCTGFLFKEKPLPRKINKEELKRHYISNAEIPLLKNGSDVINEHGIQIRNKEVTLDPALPRAYAYCSDTVYDTNIVRYVKEVDLLYHESTFLEKDIEKANKTLHSTARQAAQIAAQAGAKALLLGHFSARYRELADFLDEAIPVFQNTTLAIEGKKLTI